MRIVVMLVIVCALLSVGCNSEKLNYDAGIAAYKRGHYTAALYDFEKRANQGDPVAQFCLGYMFKKGVGVKADGEKAMEWYETAAKQGYAPAQSNLAVMYFRKSESLRYRIIDMLGRGEDAAGWINVKDRYSRNALKWFEKGGKKNADPTTQYNIALTHYFNAIELEGYAEDKDEWIELFKKAQKLQEELSLDTNSIETQKMLESLEFVTEASTNAKKAHTEAVNWFTKAAENKYPLAQYALANSYDYGEGVDENLTEAARWKEAVKWYRKAADQGNASAQNDLGKIYYDGEKIEKNLTEAVKWFRKAADQGNATARFNLGRRYYDGEGVEKNLTEAVKWYKRAAHQGNASAQNNLARMYAKGEGMPESNPEMAARWYLRAAQLGNRTAQRNLGILFETGLKSKNGDEQIPKDKKEAYYWYSLVLRSNDEANAANDFPNVRDWHESIRKQLTEPEIYEIQKRIDAWKPRILKSSGTGFYIDGNHILTNAHVVTEDGDIKHECDEIRIPYRHVKLIEEDRDVDLALLRDKDENMDRAIFRSNPVDIGEDIVSFGYPLSNVLSYRGNGTSGTVSGYSGMLNEPHPDNHFQHTAPTQGGNSGGPVFDLMGNVVGVTKSVMVSKVPVARIIKIDPPQNINFAIKFNVIEAFIQNLRKDDIPVNITVSDPAPKDIEDLDETKRQKIHAKARKFTIPVLCFKNKVEEPLPLVEIGINGLNR